MDQASIRSSEGNPQKTFSPGRRKLLTLTPAILLAGCNYSAGDKLQPLLLGVQKINDWVQEKVFDPGKLAPEYDDDKVTPVNGFRVNDYDTDEPEIDLAHWSLRVEGLVAHAGAYALEQITALPKQTKNLRHCCVEGWSMVPKWGGASMREFMKLAGADLNAKYVKVECGDDYYTSYDMRSVLHPQTLLAYEAYNKPLSLQHGAPVRIVMPTKLGYKSAKWISRIIVTNDRPGGYWEDQGYDWFAGL